MPIRDGIMLIENGCVALIKRTKQGRIYYVFPGGRREANETGEQAAAREALEELGVTVDIGACVFSFPYNGWQHFYEAVRTGGTFGAGIGEEMQQSTPNNCYEAVWLPVEQLLIEDVIPRELAQKIVTRQTQDIEFEK